MIKSNMMLLRTANIRSVFRGSNATVSRFSACSGLSIRFWNCSRSEHKPNIPSTSNGASATFFTRKFPRSRDFFGTTSMLFNAKCFCSNGSSSTTEIPTSSEDLDQQNSIPEPTGWKSEVKPAEDCYFHDDVIKRVISEVSKSNLLKEVFDAIDRTLAETSHNKIEKCDAASRYEPLEKELASLQFKSKVAANINRIGVIGPVNFALTKYKEIVAQANILDGIDASHYSLLFGTVFLLCSIKSCDPPLTRVPVTVQNVRKVYPFVHLNDLAQNVASNDSLPTKAGIPLAVQLIASAVAKAQEVQATLNRGRPEIVVRIEEVHEQIQSGDSIYGAFEQFMLNTKSSMQEQCEFTKYCNAFFACSEEGRRICADRFVNPRAGLGLTQCFTCQWNPKPDATDRDHFLFDVVNIVSGSSGSGKTISSLISSAAKESAVRCILLHVKADCSRSDLSESDTALRNQKAVEWLKSGICHAVRMGSPAQSAEKFVPLLPILHHPRGFSGGLKPWDGVVRIIIDEIGTHPEFLRALCSVWSKIETRKAIADWLGVSPLQVQLVVVGTGSDNFELARNGSIRQSYKVLTVIRDNTLFKKLFEQQIAKMFALKRPPAEQLYEMLFGKKASEYSTECTSTLSPTSDPVLRAMLGLATNARCAAIILCHMYETFVTKHDEVAEKHLSMESAVATIWPDVQLRATVSYWCVDAVAIYCSKNSLAGLGASQRHFALGKAISYPLNRRLCMDGANHQKRTEQWDKYAVTLGLLCDTAREIASDDNSKQKVFKQSADQLEFGILPGTSRFYVDDAFVTMFSLMSDSVSSKTDTAGNLLFEAAMFDYQCIAAQFGHRHPVVAPVVDENVRRATLDSTDDDGGIILDPAALTPPNHIPITPDADGFTPPHLLYGLGCETVHSATLNFKLDDVSLEKAQHLPQVQSSANFWRDSIQHDHAVVLRNGDDANCADIIVLAENRIIFTQSKHGAIDTTMISKEIFKMRRKNLLRLLCSCVLKTSEKSKQETKIEVFYVIAGGEKRGFGVAPASKQENASKNQSANEEQKDDDDDDDDSDLDSDDESGTTQEKEIGPKKAGGKGAYFSRNRLAQFEKSLANELWKMETVKTLFNAKQKQKSTSHTTSTIKSKQARVKPPSIAEVVSRWDKVGMSIDEVIAASKKTQKNVDNSDKIDKKPSVTSDLLNRFWPVMPSPHGCTTLDCDTKPDGVNGAPGIEYCLHESIHFTYAFDSSKESKESKLPLPYWPILASQLASDEKASELRYKTTATKTATDTRDRAGGWMTSSVTTLNSANSSAPKTKY